MQQMDARHGELRARCAAQRDSLAAQVSDIEDRLRNADILLCTVSNGIARPAAVAGVVAMLFATRRSGWWSLLSRGVVLLAGVRRLHALFNRR